MRTVRASQNRVVVRTRSVMFSDYSMGGRTPETYSYLTIAQSGAGLTYWCPVSSAGRAVVYLYRS